MNNSGGADIGQPQLIGGLDLDGAVQAGLQALRVPDGEVLSGRPGTVVPVKPAEPARDLSTVGRRAVARPELQHAPASRRRAHGGAAGPGGEEGGGVVWQIIASTR